MQKRGRILRDPISGPGLLMVEGQQYPFSLEGVWRSEAPPTTGMVVDVEFDSGSRVVAVTAVAESQIAKERKQRLHSRPQRKKGRPWLPEWSRSLVRPA